MTQETRRRLNERARLRPAPRSEADVPAPLRIRRFSEGIECTEPDRFHEPQLGRFSRGAERLPEDDPSKAHVGCYADGATRETPDTVHIGRFSDGAAG